MTAKIDSLTAIAAPAKSHFQIGCDKMIKAMQTAQNIAFKILDHATSPLITYFVLSNLMFSYVADMPFNRCSAISLFSTAIALPTSIALWALKSRVIDRNAAPIEEKAPAKTENPVVLITKETYLKEVLQSKVPVVLDAFASWCPPCQKIAPIVSELSQKMQGKIKFVKFNIDTEQALKKELKIEAVPTFLFIKDGKIIDRQAGALPTDDLLLKCLKCFA